MKLRGFTLLELLAVVAIIGILATIIIVLITNARVKGRDSRRVADMQQMLRAMALDQNIDSGVAFGTCTGAHDDVRNCTTPVKISYYKDPLSPGSTCSGASGPCQYSVSKKDGTAGATYSDWQIMGYLEQGAGIYSQGFICISSATSTIMSGSSCK